MRISWQVPLAVQRPYVRVGLKPDDLSRKIQAELRDLHTPGQSGVRLALDQYYLHAALDGLRPGTTYYYGVGHDGFDPADASRRSTVSSFRTAPASSEKFVFTAFGDQGSARPRPPTTTSYWPRSRPSTCTPATSATPTATVRD